RGEEVGGHVGHHQPLVVGTPGETRSLLGGRHCGYSFTRSERPRSSSFWTTSSSDFCPKLVMASRSSSVRSTSWPIVSIWARLRQLRGRSERSSSSIGRSRSSDVDPPTAVSP